VRFLEGFGVLFLLSAFLAYVLAPVVAALQRRIKVGRRRRPLSRAATILVIYVVLAAPGTLAWSLWRDRVVEWVHVTAPGAVTHLFSTGESTPLQTVVRRLPVSASTREDLTHRGNQAARYIEHETRATLDDLIAAAEYAVWLAVAPVLAFFLLTGAPSFQRSALRVLPRGHLQWRAEEYFRDVNSALAGYVRAQAAAGLIVGMICVAGFSVLGVTSAVSMGVAAGILELVPAIGPLTALLMASSIAGDRWPAVVIFLGVLRVVQDYVIYPRLIRQGMHLSTAAVIVTIWSGAALAGAAGVILAIPVAGLLSVSYRHWREFREIERLVKGAGGASIEPRDQDVA
jgi:predicted PurR-regulated permease PerM